MRNYDTPKPHDVLDSDLSKSSLNVDSPLTTLDKGLSQLPTLTQEGHATPQQQSSQPQQQKECTPSVQPFRDENVGIEEDDRKTIMYSDHDGSVPSTTSRQMRNALAQQRAMLELAEARIELPKRELATRDM